jgi:hypothetical protein
LSYFAVASLVIYYGASMADAGDQEIFVKYNTPLTSLVFSRQMGGMASPGLCAIHEIDVRVGVQKSF